MKLGRVSPVLLMLLGVALGVLADRFVLRHHGITSLAQPSTVPVAATNSNRPDQAPRRAHRAAPLNILPEPVAGSMSLEEARLALRAVLAESDPSRRYEAVTRIAKSLAEADLPEGMALGRTLTNPELRMTFGTALMRHWGEVDPAAAIQQAQSLPDHGQRMQAVSGVLSSWAIQDTEAAVAWPGLRGATAETIARSASLREDPAGNC